MHAEALAVPSVAQQVNALQHGPGRDTAPVEADATQMCAFDQTYTQAPLARPDRCDITAGTRADDQ